MQKGGENAGRSGLLGLFPAAGAASARTAKVAGAAEIAVRSAVIAAAAGAAFLLAFGCADEFLLPPLSPETVTLRRAARLKTPPPENGLLTLPEAGRIALANNPDYLSAAASVEGARMVYYQRLGAYLPRVEASFSIGQTLRRNRSLVNPPPGIAPEENNFSTSVSLQASYLFFDGLSREFQMLAAKSGLRRRELLRENAARLLLRAVAYAYYDIMLGLENERIARADLAYQENNLRQAQSRFDSGYISRSDLLNFRILLGNARASLAAAENFRVNATYALARLMGCPDGRLPEKLEFSPIETLTAFRPPDEGVCLDLALESRPDLRAWGESYRISRYRKLASLGAFFPEIRLVAGWDYLANGSHFHGYDVSRNGWNGSSLFWGVEADYLVFNGFGHYNAFREAKVQEAIAALGRDDAALSAIQEVRTACENVRTRNLLVGFYAEIQEWVRQQRDLITGQYWAGEVTVTRLNEAQYDLVAAESSLAVARINLYKSRAQLIAAVNGDALSEDAPAAPDR